MPSFHTRCFDEIEFEIDEIFRFPAGLPGFEGEREFVFLSRPESHPLIFMQSTATPELCFILLPVLVADPHYRLSLDDEALESIDLPPGRQPRIGEEILCAAVVCTRGFGEPATANLLAPIVVNLRNRVGMQAIQTQSGYSHRHPLAAREEMASC